MLDLVNRYYELQLAYAELKEFGCENIEHYIIENSFIFDYYGDQKKLIDRTSFFATINGKQTFLCEILEKCREIICKYSDLWFSHLAYPFKARMRPQVARSLINIVCPSGEGVILDPFCGSGTTNTESFLLGLNSVGIDIIPFYVFMSKAKISFFTNEIGFFSDSHPLCMVVHSACTLLKTKFKYEKRIDEIKRLQEIYMENFSSRVKPSEHKFLVGSATNIEFPDNTFDGVVTSPPYGSAISYEQENPGPPEMMKIPEKLKEFKILTKDEQSWKDLMKRAFKEIYRVLKPNARFAIIIGNQKRKGQIVDYVNWTIDELKSLGFSKMYQFTELISSTGTRNILSDEILIFRKKNI